MINDINSTLLYDALNILHFCRFCQHLHSSIGKPACDAFPEGIPRELITGQLFHNKPLPGQKNDLVFKPAINKNNN